MAMQIGHNSFSFISLFFAMIFVYDRVQACMLQYE